MSFEEKKGKKRWELRMVFRSKATFQIQNIRFGLLRFLLICQERELRRFGWMSKTASQEALGQTTNAFRPPCCVNTTKQKHKAAAGTLCSSALMWRPGRLPRWRAASSSWRQHKHRKDPQSFTVLRQKPAVEFHCFYHTVFHHLSFNWSFFNNILLLCSELQQLFILMSSTSNFLIVDWKLH